MQAGDGLQEKSGRKCVCRGCMRGGPTGHSIYAPSHAVRWITGDRRFELHCLANGHNGGPHGTYVHRDDLGATPVAGTTPANSKRCHEADESAHNPTNAAKHEYCFLVFQMTVYSFTRFGSTRQAASQLAAGLLGTAAALREALKIALYIGRPGRVRVLAAA